MGNLDKITDNSPSPVGYNTPNAIKRERDKWVDSIITKGQPHVYLLTMVPTAIFDQLGEEDKRKSVFIGVFASRDLAMDEGSKLLTNSKYCSDWTFNIDVQVIKS